MNVRPTKTLDLKPYGYDGAIVLEPPDYFRKYQLNEAIAMNCVQMDMNGKGKTIPRAGWITIMQMLVYVKSAPFEINVDSFLAFTRELDEKNFGSAEVFVNDFKDAVAKLDSELSPFVKLGTAGTAGSA